VNKKLRSVLLHEVHRSIEAAAHDAARELKTHSVDLAYPPNAGLTSGEQEALNLLTFDPMTESGVRKVIANAAMRPIFHLFALFDGVADPEGVDDWLGVVLRSARESDDNDSMLHDEFFDSYWEWRDVRPDPGWRLDMPSSSRRPTSPADRLRPTRETCE
jgi:hypothetical protein